MTQNPSSGETESYSYFVSWENVAEFREHSEKLMQILLQSNYMRDFFMAL